MTTSDNGIKLIQAFEGLRLKAYQDIVGVWTIGYGHTSGVTSGMTITNDQAIAFLRSDLRFVEAALNACPGLNQNQFDALVSLFFNVGTGWIKKGGFDVLIKAKNWDAIAVKIAKYCNAGGQIVQGLVNRRAAEIQLFKKKL